MKLITLHGRKDPAEDMADWGFNGPDIEGVEAVHSTYGNLNAFFVDAAAAKSAHLLTGWEFWDDNALTMAFHDDLLMIQPKGEEPSYFGDWELQIASPSQTQRMRDLIDIIARMTPDGEDDFIMENDDAVNAMSATIMQAREIVAAMALAAAS